jgi:hypothetical protein
MRRFEECGLRWSSAGGEKAGPLPWQACVMLACVVIVVAVSAASALLHFRMLDQAVANEAIAPHVTAPLGDNEPLPDDPGNRCSVSKRP